MGIYPHPEGEIIIHSPSSPLEIPSYPDGWWNIRRRGKSDIIISDVIFVEYQRVAYFLLEECLSRKGVSINNGSIFCHTWSTLDDSPFLIYECITVYDNGKRILFTKGEYNCKTKQYIKLRMIVLDCEHLLSGLVCCTTNDLKRRRRRRKSI